MIQFHSFDAKLLYSLCPRVGQKVTFHDIIAFVDYIDHAIISSEELTQSLHRLSIAGLIKMSHTGVDVTTECKHWFVTTIHNHPNRSVYKELNQIEQYLKGIEPGIVDLSDVPFAIDSSEFDQAIQEYISGIPPH